LAAGFFWQIQKINFFASPKIVFLDAPGESFLIVGKNGEKILVDTGKNKKTAAELLKKLPFFSRKIDAMILTHLDADHIGGAPEILKKIKVGAILTTGIFKNSAAASEVFQTAAAKKIPIFFIYKNRDAKIGKVLFDTAFPENPAVARRADKNHFMLAGRLVVGEKSIFLTGDIEKQTEKKIVFSDQKTKSDFLKVAHHGSKTSSSNLFLDAGHFQTAIIDVDAKNPFGFPHAAVLRRFSARKIPVFQTGKIGEIIFDF